MRFRRWTYESAYRAGYRDATRHQLLAAAGVAKDAPLTPQDCLEWLREIEERWAKQDATPSS